MIVLCKIHGLTLTCFMLQLLIYLPSYNITSDMRNQTYFTEPKFEWQRRYEALRASFVERLPYKVVANRFGYSPGYVRLLRHQFVHGQIDFSEPNPEGKTNRRRVSAQTRQKIIEYRQHQLSAGQITETGVSTWLNLPQHIVVRICRIRPPATDH